MSEKKPLAYTIGEVVETGPAKRTKVYKEIKEGVAPPVCETPDWSYAAMAAGESWFWRTAAGVWNPCRSMSQVVL